MNKIWTAGALAVALALGCTPAFAQMGAGPGPGFGMRGGAYSGGRYGADRWTRPGAHYARPFAARGYGVGGYRGGWGAARVGYGYGTRRSYGLGYGVGRFGYGAGYRRYGVGYAGYGRGYGGGYAGDAVGAGYYAPRISYRPAVRYAYAETPYAYDIPQETYATGIFPTRSALGLHSYDYAYTTRIRPIAAYAGLTGSYAGGYPIYNRPLAPAYASPDCGCEYWGLGDVFAPTGASH